MNAIVQSPTSTVTSGYIERFETWLTTPRFIGWLTLLILLNLFVFFWWLNRPVFPVGVDPLATELMSGLDAEKKRLQAILDDSCDSEELKAYKRGEIGPIRRSPETPSNEEPVPPAPRTKKSSPAELVGLLDAATVRVLTDSGSGTGFFINKNTVVTNRHVIEGSDQNSIKVTSKIIGATSLPSKLISASKDSNIGNADFALLRVENAPDSIKTLAVAEDPVVLQDVIAVGYPGLTEGSDSDKVTPSAVFADGRVKVLQPQPNGMTLIVHGADISPGSSGGPLVSRCGHVLGVNTFTVSGVKHSVGRSLNALSATNLRKFIEQSGVQYQKASSECVSGPEGKE